MRAWRCVRNVVPREQSFERQLGDSVTGELQGGREVVLGETQLRQAREVRLDEDAARPPSVVGEHASRALQNGAFESFDVDLQECELVELVVQRDDAHTGRTGRIEARLLSI